MKKFILGFAAFLALATHAAPALAQRDDRRERPRQNIVLLATVKLSPLADSDRVRVNSCQGSEIERVSAVRVRSIRRTANLQFIDVTYGNGNVDRITFRGALQPGQQTNWIDLTGRGRCVRDIRVVGSSGGFQKAIIEIHGMKQVRDERDREDRREEDDRRDPRRDEPRDPRRDDPRGPR
ncbi:MAG: hypothetical protein V4760_06470 [Bdellovibrionota bacterium]